MPAYPAMAKALSKFGSATAFKGHALASNWSVNGGRYRFSTKLRHDDLLVMGQPIVSVNS